MAAYYNAAIQEGGLSVNDLDSALIKKCKSGDVEAFEHLINTYQKKAYNIALRIMANEEDAKDMAQEAFIRIYKSIMNFREESSFSTWIYRIVTNVCLDEVRKRKNRGTISIDAGINIDGSETKYELSCDKETPEDIYEKTEKKEIILETINELSEEYKSAIVLRDIEGFSYEEIATIMDCSIGTVKSRINRARNILKDKLRNRLELSYKKTV